MRILRLAAILLLGISIIGVGYCAPIPFANADAERAAAIEAEKKGDFESALLHYENILDSTKTDAVIRRQLREKIAELKPKVAPNTDPSKASVWKFKALVIRTFDCKWTDNNGKKHHVVRKFTDDEIEGFKKAMKGFQDLVWDYTDGNVRIEWDLEVLERTLSEHVYDKDWGCCPFAEVVMPLVEDKVKYGEYDTIGVYVKIWKDKGDTSDDIPMGFLADCTGVMACTKGSTYIVFCGGAGLCGEPSGEVQLHEWLHAAEMTLSWVRGYPKDGPTDWTSDGWDYEVKTNCFKPDPNNNTGLPFYRHQMRDHVTRRMWRECTIYDRTDNVWLSDYIRDFIVLGPFPGEGKEFGGLNEDFIKETKVKPKLGDKTAGKEWKLASAPGRFPNIRKVTGADKAKDVCYAAFAVESEKDQVAVIRTGRTGGCKIWQDGKLILDSPWDRNFDTEPNTIDVNLKAGKNVFLVKLNNVACDWAFNLKMIDLCGNSLKGVKFTLP